jgi:hypothetical protein
MRDRHWDTNQLVVLSIDISLEKTSIFFDYNIFKKKEAYIETRSVSYIFYKDLVEIKWEDANCISELRVNTANIRFKS